MLTGHAMRIVRDADHYTDVFPHSDTIVDTYREMAKLLHPDRAGDAAAFQKLNELKAEATQMLTEGRYGERKTLAVITTKKWKHTLVRRTGDDSLAAYYEASSDGGDMMSGLYPSVVMIAKSPKDNDLVAQHVRALKLLHKEPDDLNRHYPGLLDTFLHSEGRRRAAVTARYDGFCTMAQIRDRFPQGLDPRHGAWMFRRLLMGLGRAHDLGLVHGGVTANNVLIGPEDHAVVLPNWCYSVVIDSESKTNFIKAVVPMYKQFYPEEVLAKQPASAATDIYMAAKLMNHLMPVAPKPFTAFFKGTALTKQSMRPQNAWDLLKEFDDLLENIGSPFYPRRFVEFVVPVGAA